MHNQVTFFVSVDMLDDGSYQAKVSPQTWDSERPPLAIGLGYSNSNAYGAILEAFSGVILPGSED